MITAATLLIVAATMPNLFGTTPATAITGNTRLTVTLDADGQVVGLRWPSPGFFEHAPVPVGADDPVRLLDWAIEVDGTPHTPSPDAGHPRQRYAAPDTVIIETRTRAGPAEVEQTAFVHPALDVLLLRFRVFGDTSTNPRLVLNWRPQPSTRNREAMPLHLPDARPTQAFASQRRLFVFKSFDGPMNTPDTPGIWLGIAADPLPVGITAGEPGRLTLQLGADGTAWVAVAAGHHQRTVTSILDECAGRWDALLDATANFWPLRLDAANTPGTRDSRENALARRALLTILLLQDRSSGAIVRAPIAHPPLALDFPADSVWASSALAEAGLMPEAQRHLRFLAGAMRDGREAAPDGSLALAYYADGTEAAPPAVLSLATSAGFISALKRLGQTLPPQARDDLYESYWSPARRAADFVNAWWDPVRRRPLPDFDPVFLRDRARPEQLLTAYQAMDNAIAIAMRTAEAPGAWITRRAELRALIDYHLVTDGPHWRLESPAEHWFTGAIPLTDPTWDRVINTEGRRLPTLSGTEAARTAHFLAAAATARSAPRDAALTGALQRIAGESPFATGDAPAVFWPDSITAAHIYLALMHAPPPETQE